MSPIHGMLSAMPSIRATITSPIARARFANLTHVEVSVEPGDGGLDVTAKAACTGPTGVEMEALTAVTVALLTLYDMCKALDKGMTITDVRLESKSGGRSGDWRRKA